MSKKGISLFLALLFSATIPVSAYAADQSVWKDGGFQLPSVTEDAQLLDGIPARGGDQVKIILNNLGVSTGGSTTNGKDGAVPYDQLQNAPDQSRFPKEVYLRDNVGSYNRYYELYVLDGTLYVRKRHDKGPWKIAPQPDSIKGKIKGISLDEFQALVIGPDNVIYQVHSTGSDTSEWYWDHAWGGVFRLGNYYQARNIEPYQWALSFISQKDDESYTDIDGRRHPVSVTNLMQYVYIDPDDSSNIVYNDPWLPRDESYSYGSPQHSRFKVVGLSAASSTAFVVNKYGDLYVRTHDYDFSGGDPLQFPYSWESQEGKPDASSFADQRFNPFVAAVRLPSTPWVKVEKIPGEITNRISIESTAIGNENRLLKVEGRKDGKTGFWQKALTEKNWKFIETGEPLKGTLLENSLEDTSAKDLAPATGVNYKGEIAGTIADLEVRDFAYNDNTQYATITIDSITVPAILYTEYGSLGKVITQEILPHSKGLTDDPLRYNAALYLSPSARATLEQTSEGKGFLSWFGEKDYHPLVVSATKDSLKITENTFSVPKAVTAQFILNRE